MGMSNDAQVTYAVSIRTLLYLTSGCVLDIIGRNAGYEEGTTEGYE